MERSRWRGWFVNSVTRPSIGLPGFASPATGPVAPGSRTLFDELVQLLAEETELDFVRCAGELGVPLELRPLEVLHIVHLAVHRIAFRKLLGDRHPEQTDVAVLLPIEAEPVGEAMLRLREVARVGVDAGRIERLEIPAG